MRSICASRRSSASSTVLFAALLAACAGDDGDTAAATDAATDATTGTASTASTASTTGDPCQSISGEIPFDGDPRFPTPTSLIDQANASAVGAKLTYTSGGATGLLIEVAYTGGTVRVFGEECPDTGISGSLEIPVTMTFITDDGAFNEALPASLSADLTAASSSIYTGWIDPMDLAGTFQVPATIGPHSKSEFFDLLFTFGILLLPAPLASEGEVQVGGALAECPPEPECEYWGTVATLSVG